MRNNNVGMFENITDLGGKDILPGLGGKAIVQEVPIAKPQAASANPVYSDLLTGDFYDGQIPWILAHVQKPNQVPQKKVEWALDRMIMVGGLHVFSSLPGGEKSILSLLIAKALATQTDLFGRKHIGTPITVVILDKENPAAIVYERLRGFQMLNIMNIHVWGDWESEAGPAPDKFDDPRLIECAKRMGQSVLFICDSLSAFSEGQDENSVQDMNPILRKALALARMSAGVVILHHTDKGGNAGRGTIAIRANADMAFLMEKNDEGVVTITDERFRSTQPWTMRFEIAWGGLTGIYTPNLVSDTLGVEQIDCVKIKEGVARALEQAERDATWNHYISKAQVEIQKAYDKGTPISNRTQLATLIGLDPKSKTARAILNVSESNPWECVAGDRNSIVYLPKGVQTVLSNPKRDEAEKLFAEGKTIVEIAQQLNQSKGSIGRWRSEWKKTKKEQDSE